MAKVFASRELPFAVLDRLHGVCELDVWDGAEPPTPRQLEQKLQDCEGLVCLLTDRIDRALVSACPKLRFVSSMSVGVDHVEVEALTELGIALGHTPGVLVDTTADLTWVLLMAAARRIAESDAFVRSGKWAAAGAWNPNMLVGKDVAGATLGIVGLGEIGRAVARRARGFAMQTLGWTRSGREVAGVESCSLNELLERSDFVCICVARTPDTVNLIDAAAIARMKSDAVLVNTARGGIVNEAALAEALADGRLFGAGVDVFEQEPATGDNPLLQLDNVVLTPHIGSASRETRHAMASLAVENALAALRGEPMPHCVNPQVLAPKFES
jgi:glyoxylate reductase